MASKSSRNLVVSSVWSSNDNFLVTVRLLEDENSIIVCVPVGFLDINILTCFDRFICYLRSLLVVTYMPKFLMIFAYCLFAIIFRKQPMVVGFWKRFVDSKKSFLKLNTLVSGMSPANSYLRRPR